MQINIFRCFILLIFLNGCNKNINNDNFVEKKTNIGSAEIQDSAPSDSKPLVFVEQKPQNLPLSRYGNRATYNVEGKDYDVMLSAKGYKSQGVASWYGTKFHKRLTSSGDPYDMYQLTAAHRTLPLPTYVRVKNLDNGKTAIVKVNDRGPFRKDRILDLSYAAAKQLGVFAKGTARVEVEAISTSVNPAKYYLQAGSFTSEKYAYALKNQLAKYAAANRISITRNTGSYLVRVGPYINKKDIMTLQKILLSKGIRGAFPVIM